MVGSGAFEGINDEAIDILQISIETGCRQSEISNLPPHTIVLDHPIPHLQIQDFLLTNTVGGTRHSFVSRLKKVQRPNDDREELMGHNIKTIRNRELYGDDMTLEDKLALHNLIVLAVSKHLE